MARTWRRMRALQSPELLYKEINVTSWKRNVAARSHHRMWNQTTMEGRPISIIIGPELLTGYGRLLTIYCYLIVTSLIWIRRRGIISGTKPTKCMRKQRPGPSALMTFENTYGADISWYPDYMTCNNTHFSMRIDLAKELKKIAFIRRSADNIGIDCGWKPVNTVFKILQGVSRETKDLIVGFILNE